MIKNQSGAILIVLSLMISVISIGMMFYLQSAHQTQLALKSRIKALNDATLALEQIGSELKHAYELSAPAPNSNPALPLYKRTPTLQVTPTGTDPLTRSITFFLPSRNSKSTNSGVSQGVNQICVNRSDLSDFSSNPLLVSNIKTICISLPSDLEVKSTYPTLDLNWPILPPTHKQAWLPQLIESSLSYAQSNHHSAPSLPTTPTTLISQSNTNLHASFRKQYFSDLNCPNTNQTSAVIFCLTVRLCIQASGSCSDEQYLKQTFVYYRNPTVIF